MVSRRVKSHFRKGNIYNVSGSLDTGVNLRIYDLSVKDDGDYECMVISEDGFGKSNVHVTVVGKYSCRH